jgi:5-methylcytosine-specific restriction endonuclease McrA
MSLRRRLWRGIGPLGRGIYWLLYLLWLVIAGAWRLGLWLSQYVIPRDKRFAWITGPNFYRSKAWKAVRRHRRMINRRQHKGILTCERRGCGDQWAEEYHCHHWYPRSTHPEMALKLENTGMLCEACNVGLGNRYVGRELRPNPRLAA